MAKYLFMFMRDEEARAAATEAQMHAGYEAVNKWWGENSHNGKILGGEELAAAGTATTVRFTPKGAVVTDGPYLEAKELIGGYALVDVPDLDAAIALAKGWPAGTVEIRPLVDMP